MEEEYKLEIYRQRYEMWRHFNRMDWLYVQVIIAISVAMIVGKYYLQLDSKYAVLWIHVAFGFVFIIWEIFVNRQRRKRNYEALKRIAESIGDNTLPYKGQELNSLTFFLAYILAVAAYIGLAII